MTLQAITYQTIINTINNWILTNCKNFNTTISSLPAVFKPGYTISTRYAGNDLANANYTITIATSIPTVQTSTYTTDMNNFLNTINVTNKLNTNLAGSELINFIVDITSFCSSKLGFATSQYNTNKYLIYLTSNKTYRNSIKINTTNSTKLIEDTDINTILDVIVNTIKQNIRKITCKYTITVH